MLLAARQYGPAEEQARKTLDLDPGPVGRERLGEAYLFQGRFAEAIREFQTALDLLGGGRTTDHLAHLGVTYARAGLRPEALKILNQLKALAPNGGSLPSGYALSLARLYAGLGDKDQAFAWLDRADEEHDSNLGYLLVSPYYDPLRADPRFKELLKKVGLGGGDPRRTGYIALGMIEPSAALADFEARYQRDAFRGLTYDQALARFAALWAEAVAIGADLQGDWREDLDADLAVARAVNGLPPAS